MDWNTSGAVDLIVELAPFVLDMIVSFVAGGAGYSVVVMNWRRGEVSWLYGGGAEGRSGDLM